MLQRIVICQKRHLECTLVRCKRLTFHPGPSSFTSVRYSSSLNSLRNVAESPSSQFADNLTSWTALATPFPEFMPIIHAFKCNDPFDNISQLVKSSPPLLSLFHDQKKMRDVVVNLAQSTPPHRCIDILELAHLVEYTLKHGAYEAVAYHLASNKHWDLVLLAASLGIKHAGKPTVRLLNWRARAFCELQQYGLLKDVLGEFDSAKLTPTDRTYQLVLSGCLQNHDMEGARHCLRRMQKGSPPLTARALTLIGRFHRHFGIDLKVRQNALDTLPNFSPGSAVAVLNNIIQSTLDVQDIPSTLKLLTLFEQTSVRGIVTALTSFQGRVIETPSAEPHLPVILGDGLRPNSRTFAIFMNYHIRRFNFQRAINLGELALAEGIPATEDIITSFVHAFFLQDRGNIAVEIVERLSGKSMAVEFALLKARKAPDIDPSTVPKISIVPLTTRICNALLRGILRRQGLRHVPSIFAIMHANNLEPNARTLEILVSYMSSTEGVRPLTILRIMQEMSASSFEVSVRHLHHLIRYILREEKRSYFGTGWRAYERRNRCTNQERKRSMRSLTSDDPFDPLAGIGFGSHIVYGRAAKFVLQSLVDRSVKSDLAMISLRIRRDALLHGEIESAHGVLRTLVARGINANRHHFSALMEGYSMMGDLDSAKEVMKLAQNAGVSPNVVMYTILIHGYARKPDTTSAIRVFQEMVKRDIYPDVASIDAVVGAFFSAGSHKLAREHLIMLWPYIEPFPEALRSASLATLISQFRSLDVSRSKIKRTTKARASIYHQLRRLLVAYRRYFAHSSTNRSNDLNGVK